ncbi:MAG: hypothetical protein IBJ10_10195, partial [Phycisphaerales bacterium]|nr:hypothetical protein [Phycisphaerales bacterium]
MNERQRVNPCVRALDLRVAPREAIARGARDRRLVALTSAGDGDGRRRSRWTILTEPPERSMGVGAGGLDELDGALRGTRVAAGSRLPFV